MHEFKYAMKTMLRNKTAFIWTLLFPIALGTFMNMAFGRLYEEEALFTQVPVAIVKEVEKPAFDIMVKELEEDALLSPSYLSESEAKDVLKKEKVSAILYVGEDIRMEVNENSYEVTMLESIVKEYKKQEKLVMDIGMQALAENKEYFVSRTTSDGNQNVMTNYFYAIFAMSCLFASLGAIEKIGKLQANVSPLGMRRCLAPNRKINSILAEFFSMLLFQMLAEVIALLYFIRIGIDFGNKYPQMVLVLFFGSCIGIALGIIIGAVSRLSEGMKAGICISVSMIFSVLADLCASGIKDNIEHTAPIFNRLNPAALITDCFYALNIYDTNTRYWGNITILAVMTIILLCCSYWMLRRNKYASL